MDVPYWVWALTIAGLLVLLALDLFIVDRKPHEISVKEAGIWVAFYVAIALAFGLGVLYFGGAKSGGEFFAGYLTEYSLSVDNLFIFVIIMSRFAVPAIHQHRVLLIGILLALVMRGIFIGAGAAIIERFQGVFFLFGAFLIWTAWQQVKSSDEGTDFNENVALRWIRRVVPTTPNYVDAKLTVRIDGKRETVRRRVDFPKVHEPLKGQL